MKLESQITNTQYRRSRHIGNHSSLIDNQSKRRSTPVENVRQITPLYAKQTQFRKWQNEHKHFHNNEICKFEHWLKPKQTQFKPNKAKNKANQSQFVERPKMNPFAWLRSLTIVLIMLLADLTTLKGANFKQHSGRKKIFKPDNIKNNIYQIARHSLVAVT
jgi:hypothetical protein